MVHDYSITKCTRKCAVSGRGLAPGESFVSVLLPNGDEFSRIDIAASEWKGPQAETIGWWRSRMPEAAAKKLRPAPNGVLLDTLSELLEIPGKEALAYLLALLLMRRRVLTEEQQLDLKADSATSSSEPDSPDDLLPQQWSLVCPADGRQWNVPVVVPPAAAVQALQDELNTLLFTEA